jgi:iron-sulfur cluster assembly protein|tara:strand:+ start:103 stop:423 length:321 start_codon:yes stop_codon:yes gene_type:complete
LIHVTPKAVSKIATSIDRRGHGIGIRLGVRTTGCSGLAYVLEYVDNATESDLIFESEGFKIVVDPKDLPILDELQVDYVRTGLNEGFEFANPQEKDRCGCGESFRV